MEAKEKANELFNNCCDYADYTDEDSCFTERETMYKNAKMIALIVVNEVLHQLCVVKSSTNDTQSVNERLLFFNQVKKEIENIELCDNNLLKLPKKYSEKHLKYAYIQGSLKSNPCYSRTFENVLSIINNNQCKDNQ